MSTTRLDEDSPTQPLPVLRKQPGSRLGGEITALSAQQPAQSNDLTSFAVQASPRAEPEGAETHMQSKPAVVVPETAPSPPSWPGAPAAAVPAHQRQGVQDTPPGQAPGVLTPAPAATPVLKQHLGIVSWLALVIAGLSLLLNIIVISQFLQVRAQVKHGLDQAIAQLDGMCSGDSPTVVFPISQTIRFQGEIPMPQGLVIPFKGNIPFNTTIRVESFPGGPVINVPINTVVPVDTKVPIPGGIVIPVDTTIPFRQDIPIDLCTEASPFGKIMRSLMSELRALQANF